MADMTRARFTKGHGTENDFVLVPDLDGSLGLTAERSRRLADRRAGIGGDGVIRVVPTALADEPSTRELAAAATWFMDYRNADGSIAQMCGNGTRVFAAYLDREGLAPQGDFAIATRAGLKRVRRVAEGYAVDLGRAVVDEADQARTTGFNALVATAGSGQLPGVRVDLGNPHTVVLLPPGQRLADVDLSEPPQVTPTPAEGTNVEIVQVLGPGHLAMRVHERGVGETRSCGTGAVAAAAAVRWWHRPGRDATEWVVDVPGGRLTVRFTAADRAELAGPAALVADGETDL
jgi:diaminopimelate epimerase